MDRIGEAPNLVELGKRLAAARKNAGFHSYAAVERALGWSLRKYENYEKGRTTPNYAAIWELANLFGVTANDLLGFGGAQGNQLDVSSDERILARNLPKITEEKRAAIHAAVRKACAVTATEDDVLDAVDLLLARLRERTES